MRYTLKITNLAKQDLQDIWRNLTEFQGLKQADEQLVKIEQKFQFLLQFPCSGRSRATLHPELRSLVAGEFVIFYRVSDIFVEIVRILHGRRDIEHLFENTN
jgi:toxin ParE1/3/4